MEENKKVNLEEVEAKENDCELTDEELENAAGGIGKTARKKMMKWISNTPIKFKK